jgi:1-acyl-sn-glycerol-3-phosphate acyltransferase
MNRAIRFLITAAVMPLLAAALLLANLLQMLSLVLLPFSAAAFRQANRWVSGSWFAFLAFVLQRIAGVPVVQSGDPLPYRENAFVLSNHQAMADIPFIVILARRCGRAGDLKWFVKDPLKWMPGIGWGMLFLDCLFVKRNWTADRERVMSVFARLRDHRSPFWVISFLEGTRATPAKIQRSRAFAAKAGLPALQHVLNPRSKGFTATLEGLDRDVEAVYDVTIGYPGPPPTLTQLFFGGRGAVHLHVRRYPARELPRESGERVRWVNLRFEEKDQLLAHFYRAGSFPEWERGR